MGRYERHCGRTVEHGAHRWGHAGHDLDAWCDGLSASDHQAAFTAALDAHLGERPAARPLLLDAYWQGGWGALRLQANRLAESALRLGPCWRDLAALYLGVARWAYEQRHGITTEPLPSMGEVGRSIAPYPAAVPIGALRPIGAYGTPMADRGFTLDGWPRDGEEADQ